MISVYSIRNRNQNCVSCPPHGQLPIGMKIPKSGSVMLFSYFCTAFNRTESIKQTVGNTSTHIIGKLAGPNSRPVIFIKIPQIYMANQRSTNNEYIHYTQSNALHYITLTIITFTNYHRYRRT